MRLRNSLETNSVEDGRESLIDLRRCILPGRFEVAICPPLDPT